MLYNVPVTLSVVLELLVLPLEFIGLQLYTPMSVVPTFDIVSVELD